MEAQRKVSRPVNSPRWRMTGSGKQPSPSLSEAPGHCLVQTTRRRAGQERGPPAYTQQTPLEWDVSSQLQNGYRGGGGGGARTGMWAECSDILDVGRKTKHFAIAVNTQSLLIFQILNTVFSHALRSRLKLIYTSQCFALALEDTESLFLLSEQLTNWPKNTGYATEKTEGGNPAATDGEQRELEQGRGLTGRTNQWRAKTRRCHAIPNKVY